ncbi:MAG: hypothetical protein WBB19_09125 [Desulforhopalus sp.]
MTDWNKKTLAHWKTINNMAIRRFGEGVLAEEAALAVIDELRANNWRKVRAYSEKATFESFLGTLTVRLLEDFARKRFGRVRPPLWVKTFGGIWEKLFTALCLERLTVNEAVEVVGQRQVVATSTEIADAAYQLLARIPDCGMHQGLEVPFDEENSPDGDFGEPVLCRPIEDKQKRELFEAIFEFVLRGSGIEVADGLLKKFNQLEIRLLPEEKLLLKLCYQDGLGVVKAGEMLGMNRFQAHGKKRRLLARLKKEFERTGLLQDLGPLLDV